MRLEDVKKCSVCNSGNLIPHSNIPVPDIFTDIETCREVLQCEKCDTLHYIDEGGTISYEFSCKLGQNIGKKVVR